MSQSFGIGRIMADTRVGRYPSREDKKSLEPYPKYPLGDPSGNYYSVQYRFTPWRKVDACHWLNRFRNKE